MVIECLVLTSGTTCEPGYSSWPRNMWRTQSSWNEQKRHRVRQKPNHTVTVCWACVCLVIHMTPPRSDSPPVFVELSVSKLQQLCHKVQRRVEKPVEEDQPYEMVRDLEVRRRECLVLGQNSVIHLWTSAIYNSIWYFICTYIVLTGRNYACWVSATLTANFRSRSIILEKSISCKKQ